jgi:hypothetical protein
VEWLEDLFGVGWMTALQSQGDLPQLSADPGGRDPVALQRPAWMRDALCKEYPSSRIPRHGQDSSAAIAVYHRCNVMTGVPHSGYSREGAGHLGGLTARARDRLRVTAA